MPEALTIGVLGGGQLGRMLALAAAPLGLKVHVYCPEADSPAFEVASAHTIAAYEDEDALRHFAALVDVVTYEFENVPARTAEVLGALKPVRPGAAALAMTQDRLVEKSFIRDLGIGVPRFARVDDADELEAALATIGRPAVLKTRRFGYDGKGQVIIREGDDASAAFAALKGVPCILEAFVPFTAEVSIVAARGVDGAFAAYDLTYNVHRHHILHTSTVPSGFGVDVEAQAVGMARRIAAALEYIGVFAIEFFVLADGGLLVNEMAPRVHNSGHWTRAACTVSQFEQHMRAVAGFTLGDPRRHSDAVMTNLIGDDVEQFTALLAEPQASIELYGKREARAGRKMGHVTRITPRKA